MLLVTIAPDYPALCALVAGRLAALVRAKPDAVLGLATGATPLGVYERLGRLYQRGELDFSGVRCFNLDEYYPMAAMSPHSYHAFMKEHLFRHINCTRWAVPDGSPGTMAEIAERCRRYEAAIAEAGGIDWQLLGIGRTGHLGFNEPGSPPESRTRLVSLDPLTRADAAPEFGGLPFVPTQAVSMGLGTILEAREIALMASGAAKAEIVQAVCAGEPTADIPASWLHRHPNARLYTDKRAAERVK